MRAGGSGHLVALPPAASRSAQRIWAEEIKPKLEAQ